MSTPATSRRSPSPKAWPTGCRAYFTSISDDRRQFMLRTEYGGMNEVLANLYGLTGKEQYLRTAHLFEQPIFLDPLAAHRDELRGLHANTHVPKVIGAARMYELTGDTRYREIAQYFLEEVLTERCYVIGNTSVGESWRSDAGNLKGSLEYHDAECCVAYNLMKLERHVFAWTGDARWMDAYERTLWNCRMGTQNPQGLKQYFFPLAAGYWRFYNSAEGSFWCCTGTGAEEFAKFNDTIYFHDTGQRLGQPVHRFGTRLEAAELRPAPGDRIPGGAGNYAAHQGCRPAEADDPRPHPRLGRGRRLRQESMAATSKPLPSRAVISP